MENLIHALMIFFKYGNPEFPTHCEHDELRIMSYHIGEIRKEDVEKLDELGFFWSEDDECFKSFIYGSA